MSQTGAGDTQAMIDEITRLQLDMMKISGEDRRGQHPKMHGCVEARFEVAADIPANLKVGLFAEAKTYRAYMRFSNGKETDDTKKDVHGLAIKLLCVPGQKALEPEAAAETHDFILADNPVFIIRDTAEYLRFVRIVAGTNPPGKAIWKFLLWQLFNHPMDALVLLRFQRKIEVSPLAAQFWSQVPYAFGENAEKICRYAVVPHGALIDPVADVNPDFLRQAMVRHLSEAKREAKFDFMAQVHDKPTDAIINNPTVEWDLPWQRVATITIPPQVFDTPAQRAFGENLSFTPWHALPAHRPLGDVNDIRKNVYLASAKLRHAAKGTIGGEPPCVV